MKTSPLLLKIKRIVLLLLAVLTVVLVLQNTQAVATRLLFVTVSMPLAILLVVTLLIGFAGGVFAAIKIGRQSERKEAGSP